MALTSIFPSNTEPTPTFHAESDNLRQLLVHIRRHLHAHPELGFAEDNTSQFIQEVLEAYDLEVQGPVARTGLFVDIEGEHPGPTVAYRADIDALPIQDGKNVSYASKTPEVAHLCGHDAHTAIAIGVALLLHNHRDQICGRIRVFFQPAEEIAPSGAPEMIADGILTDVEAVYALHTDPSLPVGRFGLRKGPITAATDAFHIEVQGKSTGHSARPHEADDTIWIAHQIANTLYQLTGRIQDTRSPAVLTICTFHGGDAINVVPDRVEFGGTLRTVLREDRTLLNRQIKETVEKYGQMYDVQTNVTIDYGAPPVSNDQFLIDTVAQVLTQQINSEAVHWIPNPSMGGEDFAHYLTHVPGALIRLGTSDGPDTSYPLHDAHFDISEDALPLAVQIMSQVLIDTLKTYAQEKSVPPPS